MDACYNSQYRLKFAKFTELQCFNFKNLHKIIMKVKTVLKFKKETNIEET